VLHRHQATPELSCRSVLLPRPSGLGPKPPLLTVWLISPRRLAQ
jgi:hypothetical protein